jgi:uncharacterized protein YecE (DUF72 family)
MKFGAVDNPEAIDFSLPADHPDTKKTLAEYKSKKSKLKVYVGCAKWNRSDLKGFYPRGTKDELTYYAQQFNSIELNNTHYRFPKAEQVKQWKEKTPSDFKFFPKVPRTISHFKRLIDVERYVEDFVTTISQLEEKLGMIFLQVQDNFQPKDLNRVERFISEFPKGVPLAIEVRHKSWFEGAAAKDLYKILQSYHVSNIIVDTAGRRDMLHMRLSSEEAFVRFVGANVDSDYTRLDKWVDRIASWKTQGLQRLDFFIHQNIEKESPLLAAHFIEKLNGKLGLNLRVPNKL